MSNIKNLISRAKKNDLYAKKRLAFTYYQNQDYKNALYWWNQALAQGDKAAHFNIGVCYHEGWGVKKNFSKAFKNFSECIKFKKNRLYADALYTLGLMYINGEATKKNQPRGIELIKEASENNNSLATSYLATILNPNTGILKKKYADAKKSFQFHLKNADLGLAISQFEVGRAYLKGIGTKKNMKLAYQYLLLAFRNKNKKQHGMTNEQFEFIKKIMKKYYPTLNKKIK